MVGAVDESLSPAVDESSLHPGASLIGADLRGVDLSGYDLRGADLSQADLTSVRAVGTSFAGAVLHEAKLDGAQLLNVDLSDATLTGAHATNANFGASTLRGARLFGADLTNASLSQACLADAEMRAAVFDEARLRDVDLTGADASSASFIDADLTGAQVAGAALRDINISGARLKGLTGYANADWVGCDATGSDFTGAYLARRVIIDQNYLHEFRTQSPTHEWIYRLWWLTSDCGRSYLRWGLCTLLFALVFAGLYEVVDIDYGDNETALSSIYFSIVTLTTLGYGDVLPASQTAQAVVIGQVITGYVMLGGLLSIFSTKMSRRGE
ncbi:MAG: pentapeptide repeat-containing protein [Actinomycetota bacterium]